ncbi:MAG: pyrimidine 5'-nucleotidase [Rhodospirillaceae bacterium]|nr:pyrimidine 5'-nucleotidase [Rhodospirillaceae bacterium]
MIKSMKDNINTWIFDLDNTLYDVGTDLFAKVSRRMTVFIQNAFQFDEAAAKHLQKEMFLKYGTTMRGLMVEHDMDPEEFLHFVHDIDVSDLEPDPVLKKLLEDLPGRRLIFTNGSVPHAQRITEQLGIGHLFEGIFDIVAANFLPKPEPITYQAMVDEFDVVTTASVMIDDMAKNLIPASNLGIRTVWLKHDKDWSSKDFSSDHIDEEISDLKRWLATV